VEFNQIITDTTISVMKLQEEMEWPHKENLAVSPYSPLKNPLFVVDLILVSAPSQSYLKV